MMLLAKSGAGLRRTASQRQRYKRRLACPSMRGTAEPGAGPHNIDCRGRDDMLESYFG
jgi:hypothetical protein